MMHLVTKHQLLNLKKLMEIVSLLLEKLSSEYCFKSGYLSPTFAEEVFYIEGHGQELFLNHKL